MIRKAIKFRPAPHLRWRNGDPIRDFDERGRPIQPNYVAITRAVFGDPKDAPCLPGLSHSRTNMAYGPWRKRNRPINVWRKHKTGEVTFRNDPEGTLIDQLCYWTCPVYWVEDARVYRGTIQRYDEPKKVAA